MSGSVWDYVLSPFTRCFPRRHEVSPHRSFPNDTWTVKPWEMREKIVERMDFVTRTRFGMTSRDNRRLVESIPLFIDELVIETNELHFQIRVTVGTQRVEMELGVNKVKFKRLEESNPDEENAIHFESSEQANAWMEEFFVEILMNDNKEIGFFEASANMPDIVANQEEQLNVKSFKTRLTAVETMRWLNKLDQDTILESLIIDAPPMDIHLLVGLGSHPLVMNAKKLEITRVNDITDDQLWNFECEELDLTGSADQFIWGSANLRLSANGIRRFVQKIRASDFKIHSYWNIKVHCTLDNLLEGYPDYLITHGQGGGHAFLPINNQSEKKLWLKCSYGIVYLTVVSAARGDRIFDPLDNVD